MRSRAWWLPWVNCFRRPDLSRCPESRPERWPERWPESFWQPCMLCGERDYGPSLSILRRLAIFRAVNTSVRNLGKLRHKLRVFSFQSG
jgi:hypothetical protein